MYIRCALAWAFTLYVCFTCMHGHYWTSSTSPFLTSKTSANTTAASTTLEVRSLHNAVVVFVVIDIYCFILCLPAKVTHDHTFTDKAPSSILDVVRQFYRLEYTRVCVVW